MASWTAWQWGLIALGAPAGLYGLHRLGLWLERRGLIYYLHKERGRGAANGFIALQEIVDPRSGHVIRAQDEEKRGGEGGAPPLFRPDAPGGSRA